MAFLHAGVGPVTRCTYGVIVERFNARGTNGDFSVRVYLRGGSKGTAKKDVFLSSLRLYLDSIAFVLLFLVPRTLPRYSSSTTTTTTTYTRYEYLTYARTILLRSYTRTRTRTKYTDILTQTHEKGIKRDAAENLAIVYCTLFLLTLQLRNRETTGSNDASDVRIVLF